MPCGWYRIKGSGLRSTLLAPLQQEDIGNYPSPRIRTDTIISPTHHARRGVAISAMSKLLALVVMREVRTTAKDKIKASVAKRATTLAAAAAAT